MHRLKKWGALLLFCLVLTIVAILSEFRNPIHREPISKTSFLLNTFVTVTLYEYPDPSLLDSCIKLCEQYETILSRTRTDSELYQLNHRTKPTGTITVSDTMAAVLSKALYYCDVSDGSFDITVAPIVDLWDFKASTPTLPSKTALAEAVSKTDWHQITLSGNELTFLSPDTQIDLGAIAKGYIADQLKQYLAENGVTSAVISLGGNILCIGNKVNNEPFVIGLQKPFVNHSETIAQLHISDYSVVTSGVYERHFILDNKNYHHLLDPKTGMPYENGLISVTILSKDSIDADALSTVCFSLGLEKGLALVQSLDDVYAYFITDDYTIHYSNGAKDFLKT